jgi:hypothetical protein
MRRLPVECSFHLLLARGVALALLNLLEFDGLLQKRSFAALAVYLHITVQTIPRRYTLKASYTIPISFAMLQGMRSCIRFRATV